MRKDSNSIKSKEMLIFMISTMKSFIISEFLPKSDKIPLTPSLWPLFFQFFTPSIRPHYFLPPRESSNPTIPTPFI